MKTQVAMLLNVCVLIAGLAMAQDARPTQKGKDKAEDVQDKKVVTQHTATIQGKEVKYTATAGTLVMRSEEGDPKGQIFTIAYTLDGVTDTTKRPITFVFNGGPGAASVWLHLGMLGPMRIKVPDDASPAPLPHSLVNNPHSLLDITDLVFIDPIGTGYSRAVRGEDRGQFLGYQNDINSVSQFIHDFITKNSRWRSPKFVIGESYGGTRASGLSERLFERYRIALNGVILISPSISSGSRTYGAGSDTSFVVFLPTFAATAWYHKALAPDLQALPVDEVFRQAKEFATTEYLLALAKGHMLSDAERSTIAEKMSRLTGLSKAYVESANLRVSQGRFSKELLRSRGQTVARYDGRYTGIDADNAGERAEYDANDAKVFGAFTTTINDYLRHDLKFVDDKVYETLAGLPWDRGGGQGDSAGSLRQTLAQNPLMKLFVACGYYDMACPPVSATYTVEHMMLPASLRGNVSYGYYDSGHMIYLYEPAMEKLRKDLEKFYSTAYPQ